MGYKFGSMNNRQVGFSISQQTTIKGENKMFTTVWMTTVLNILSILSIIIGLWIAGRILPMFIVAVDFEDLRDRLNRPFVRAVLWFALGTLLSFPLLDFVRLLGNLATYLISPLQQGRFTTILGTVSIVFYSSFHLLLMLVIYGAVLWLLSEIITLPGKLNQIERTLLSLSVASLVYRGILAIFTQIFSLQLPIGVSQDYGVPGFLLEILIGLFILIAIVVLLDRLLPTHPVSSE
jgi:hypothetical protein